MTYYLYVNNYKQTAKPQRGSYTWAGCNNVKVIIMNTMVREFQRKNLGQSVSSYE